MIILNANWYALMGCFIIFWNIRFLGLVVLGLKFIVLFPYMMIGQFLVFILLMMIMPWLMAIFVPFMGGVQC